MDQNWDANTDDSTTNNNDGTRANQISSDQDTGKIGGTVKFRGGGAASYTVTDNVSLNSTTNITASLWFKRAGPSATWPYIWLNGTSGNYWILAKTNANKFAFSVSAVNDYTSNQLVDEGHWHMLTAVKNGDSGTNLTLYIDGREDRTASIGSIGTQTGNKQMIVGDSVDTWIDEFRISDTARSVGWIQTEFNNQNNPASFYSFGATQTSSKSGAGGTGSAPAVKVRGQVKFR
jgi:hypothetical protein